MTLAVEWAVKPQHEQTNKKQKNNNKLPPPQKKKKRKRKKKKTERGFSNLQRKLAKEKSAHSSCMLFRGSRRVMTTKSKHPLYLLVYMTPMRAEE